MIHFECINSLECCVLWLLSDQLGVLKGARFRSKLLWVQTAWGLGSNPNCCGSKQLGVLKGARFQSKLLWVQTAWGTEGARF